MNSIISTGVIAIFSSAVSILLSFVIERWKSKQEKERAVLQIEINTYASAIQYIMVLSRLSRIEEIPGNEEMKDNLRKEEQTLYNSFHPLLSIIASRKKIESYNALRNQIKEEHLTPEEAYNKAIKVLDYNIWEN